MSGHPGPQPFLPPLRQPLAHCPLSPLDHLRDNIQADATGGAHNRLRLHLYQLVGVRALFPPDEDVPLLVRHVDPREAVLYEMLRKRQPGIPQQLLQNAILFNSSHTLTFQGYTRARATGRPFPGGLGEPPGARLRRHRDDRPACAPRTDLGTEPDRSRYGSEPISVRK